jgi:hypothetical protein
VPIRDIFVFKSPEEVSYEALSAEQWISVEADHVMRIVYIIHAMDLTDDNKGDFAGS